MSLSVHYIIAAVLATALAVLLSQSKKNRAMALGIVPVLFYILFYNYDYGLLDSPVLKVIPYAGGLYTCLFFLYLSSGEKIPEQTGLLKRNIPIIILLSVLQFLCILYALLLPWGIDTFPLSNIDAVMFTLFAGTNEGSEEFVISSAREKVLIPAVQILMVMLLAQIAATAILCRKKWGFDFHWWKLKYSLNATGYRARLRQMQKGVLVCLGLYGLVQSIVLPGIFLSAPFKALFQIPVDSELYRDHFVDPDSAHVKPPEKLRNLIVIMLESMETNFERFTPEIVELQRNNTNFAPGGVSVAGTSWTIAGITGKLCGIPLNMPMGIDEYLGKLPTYLPYANCLMDYLEKYNYEQIYMQGSSGEFTQKRKFWTVHGNVAVHDIEYYRRKGNIPENYRVFWGFEDRKLYHFAQKELDSLSAMDRPFALYMLTVDTHQPEGYVDALCAKEFPGAEEKLPTALRCASKQLKDFVSWAQEQPWFANTVISVMGDHTMPNLSPKAHIPLSDSLYWINFIVNSSIEAPVRERQYTSFDMFPTLLEAMGFELEGRSAGLGRSLYSDSLTMLEIYGRRTLDSLLRERSVQYDKFLFGK